MTKKYMPLMFHSFRYIDYSESTHPFLKGCTKQINSDVREIIKMS